MSVVPLLLGGSDSLSVSYGMEPEQEALSIVSFKDREAASPVNKLNLKIFYVIFHIPDRMLSVFHLLLLLTVLHVSFRPVLSGIMSF